MQTYIPYRLFRGAFVPDWLMSRKEVSTGAKLCFGKLCQYSGKNGECYPSADSLAKDLGLSARSINDYIRELKQLKLITSKRRGFGKTNNYFFLKHPWISLGEEKELASPPFAQNPAQMEGSFAQNPAYPFTQDSAQLYKDEENSIKRIVKEKYIKRKKSTKGEKHGDNKKQTYWDHSRDFEQRYANESEEAP